MSGALEKEGGFLETKGRGFLIRASLRQGERNYFICVEKKTRGVFF